MGLGRAARAISSEEEEEKLGQVPRLRCSEAVREGFEAEKTALQREQRSLTALGEPVSGLGSRRGSR